MPDVPQVHERLDRLQLDGQLQRVAERAVRVGKSVEQIPMLVVRRNSDQLRIAGEEVHLEHGLVRHTVAERRRLDAQTGDRST
jgi:hypothetical protein